MANPPACRDCDGDGEYFTGARYLPCERCSGAGVEMCGECPVGVTPVRVVAAYADTCSDGSGYYSQVCARCARRLCGLIDIDPITAEELREFDEAANALSLGCDSWYDRKVYLALVPKHRVYCATVVCGLCHYATPENDRLPLGAGVAHAACAMRVQVKATSAIEGSA